ncbi:hypothetical protein B484DRAFT_425373, partial [Ochromonadaceae sp. CCMP2298]
MWWSAHKLPLLTASIDILLIDLPFGKMNKKVPKHYRANVPRYVAEIARVLRAGGRLVTLVQAHKNLVTSLDSIFFADIKTLFDKFDSDIEAALFKLADCPPDLRAQLRTLRRLPQKLGGLGIYDYGGLQGLKGRNHSRATVYEFARANYHSSLFQQTNVGTWGVLDLRDEGDAELNHVLPDAVGAFAKRVKESRVAESQALHREKMETCKAEAAWYL